MKTGMELVKELEEEMNETLMGSGESHAYAVCIGKLQAWLREADEELTVTALVGRHAKKWIREALLGTTQSSGVSRRSREGEK